MLTPFDSWIASSFTASPSTKRTSLRSRVNTLLSCSSNVLSMSTFFPASRPLTRKTTRPPPIVWRWILQVTGKRLRSIASETASVESKFLATRNLVKRTGRQKYLMGGGARESYEFCEFCEFCNSDGASRISSKKFELEFVDFQCLDTGLESRGSNSELLCGS